MQKADLETVVEGKQLVANAPPLPPPEEDDANTSHRSLPVLRHNSIASVDFAAEPEKYNGTFAFVSSWRKRISRFRPGIPKWLMKHITFYRIHFTCFVLVDLIGTLFIYLGPKGPQGPISFIDALYSATSAVTVTGLTPVYMNVYSTADVVVMIVMVALGSQIFTSLIPVWVRRFYFHRYLQEEDPSVFNSVMGTPAIMSHNASYASMPGLPGWGAPVDPTSGISHSIISPHSEPLSSKVKPVSRDDSGWLFSSFLSKDTSATSSAGVSTVNLSGANLVMSPLPTILSAAGMSPREEGSGYASHGHTWSGDQAAAEGLRLKQALEMLRVEREIREKEREQMKKEEESFLLAEPVNLLKRRLKRMHTAGSIGYGSHNASMEDLMAMATEVESEDGGSYRGGRRGPGAETPKAGAGATGEEHTPSGRVGITVGEDAGGVSARLAAAGEMLNRVVPSEHRFIELRALELLSWLVPLYFFGIQVVCFFLYFAIVYPWPYYSQMLQSYGVAVTFNSFFMAISSLTGSGFTPTDPNLIPFNENTPYLLLTGTLILLGNTMYAPTLRGILYLLYWGHSSVHPRKYVCKYLLDHPRKCYTHLFPASATFWLIITVIAFNVLEFICFCALDWNGPALADTPQPYRALNGIFQSISTRSAGFVVVVLSQLSPAMLVLYTGLMYCAVYPVYLTRQTSREQRDVYGDEDIGVFIEDLKDGVGDKVSVLSQSKKLVGKDSVLLFLSVFIICIIQTNEIENDNNNFSIFNVIFEVVSAYGNVGLTLGYTCPEGALDCVSPPFAFSGVWKPLAKLLLIFVMLLGRHRGLPDNIDAAVTIPGRKQFRRFTHLMAPFPPREENFSAGRTSDSAELNATKKSLSRTFSPLKLTPLAQSSKHDIGSSDSAHRE